MFHRWLSADEEDQCIGCGVVSPDFGEGVVSDHGPLPITCPGPEGTGAWPAHHFHSLGNGEIQCHSCGEIIGGDTLPADVEWRCNPAQHWQCDVHPDATPDHVDSGDGMILWSCGCIT
jgi:hypothetical protein